MINAFVDIGDHRLNFKTGLVRLEITDEYGFTASSAIIEVNFNIVKSLFPELLTRPVDEQIYVTAYMSVDGDMKDFHGIIEAPSGDLNAFEIEQETLTFNARSVLALLQDEEDNLITKAYPENTDWSTVVRDLVTMKGFDGSMIVNSGVLAGDQRGNGNYFLSIDEQTPGQVIQNAVSATGFVANTHPNKKFYFVPPDQLDRENYTTLVYRRRDPETDILSARFAEGALSEITTYKKMIRLDPGDEVSIIIPGENELTGKYFVTRSRYIAVPDDQSQVQFSIVRELPELKSG